MRLLFAISIASFCTVLWLALALARRVRRDHRGRVRPYTPATAGEFFEAGEYRTPRVLRLNQDISQQSARRSLEDAPAAQDRQHGHPKAVEAATVSGASSDLRETADAPGSEAVIVNSKLHFVPFAKTHQRTEPLLVASPNTPSRDLSGERKSPQSARSGTFRRVDLSHYNKDLGDLTDPYTHTPRNSGMRPSVAKNG